MLCLNPWLLRNSFVIGLCNSIHSDSNNFKRQEEVIHHNIFNSSCIVLPIQGPINTLPTTGGSMDNYFHSQNIKCKASTFQVSRHLQPAPTISESKNHMALIRPRTSISYGSNLAFTSRPALAHLQKRWGHFVVIWSKGGSDLEQFCTESGLWPMVLFTMWSISGKGHWTGVKVAGCKNADTEHISKIFNNNIFDLFSGKFKSSALSLSHYLDASVIEKKTM